MKLGIVRDYFKRDNKSAFAEGAVFWEDTLTEEHKKTMAILADIESRNPKKARINNTNTLFSPQKLKLK